MTSAAPRSQAPSVTISAAAHSNSPEVTFIFIPLSIGLMEGVMHTPHQLRSAQLGDIGRAHGIAVMIAHVRAHIVCHGRHLRIAEKIPEAGHAMAAMQYVVDDIRRGRKAGVVCQRRVHTGALCALAIRHMTTLANGSYF